MICLLNFVLSRLQMSTAALQARRQQLLRQRLEERQRARKHAKAEERRRAAIKQ